MPQPQRQAHEPFKDYTPGYIRIDVKYLPQIADEDKRRYLSDPSYALGVHRHQV